MPYQSIAINTMKLIPINNQKIGVNNSFLMPNRIVINTKELAHIKMETNTLENGKMINITDKELAHIKMETNTLENGKMEHTTGKGLTLG